MSRRVAGQDGLDAASAFDLLPEAYVILNGHYQIVLANARYLELTGQKLDDLLGQSILDTNQVGSAAQRDARRAWLSAALRELSGGDGKWSSQFRYDAPAEPPNVGSAGSAGAAARPAPAVPRYWRIKASLLATPLAGSRSDSATAHILLRVSEETAQVFEDERNQRERAKLRSQAQLRQVLADEAREQLREHQERFQLALAFSQLGAWELYPATGAIDATDQCKANLGLAPGTTLTEQLLLEQVVHPDDRERVRVAMERALAAREHFEVDYRVGWASGVVRWILVRGVGRFVRDGTLASVIGFTLDITVRKEAELEQRAIAASEKRAREQSERLAMAMDHFVTTVSHELRSPLSAIVSWTDLLRRLPDPVHVTRATDVIGRNARQLSHMVDDLLDSGAIVTGKLSVRLEPVDLGALAGIVAEDLRMQAEAKGLRLIADDLAAVLVLADESRMKQVVWNLVSNALKFTAQGTIELSVRALGEQVELTVRDSGAGLDQASLERIFERFEQSGASGGGRVAGLGLGLWLVKNLLEMHGGTIRAESAGLGHGSVFRVTLPVYR
ncbi:PAS domain-containing sensor histidine kinase [Paraburkholderia sp. MMS20-SJTR3]|uniref:histidine kinase n=1 Tax=Paraburkholderia sejongensis TaxID=2886946 RepID=A0ABS8K092_9BURK|nr:PAS domain-containing sensor histidine kinase [Paraburkholderia sp. MMS20-SJTR3]MCC8395508.1 PAS domain-containing sensor histidine kinase [Paraburkholderia sp. MMS20-SJTR3]